MPRSPKTGRATWREEHQRLVALLREARERAGLSQGQLAARLGREQSYVSKLERVAQGFEVMELLDYCAAVGVSASELIRDVERGSSRRLRRAENPKGEVSESAAAPPPSDV